MTTKVIRSKFNPGQIVATSTFTTKCDPSYAITCLEMHCNGDWGLVDKEDWERNDKALKHGGRLLSAYPLPNNPDNFWIITEHDRSVTTFLLPEDY